MSSTLYVKTILSAPEIGTVIHVAELEEVNASECTLRRLIALDTDHQVMETATPNTTVPHPDSYSEYPDITTETVAKEEFDALWVTT